MNKDKLLRLAKSGDIDAKYQLARLAEDAGQIDEAKKWFHEAAAGGSPAAMNAIGLLAHIAGDLEKARNWYEKAANNGYSMALNNLGTISEDPEEARNWFDAGVKAGNSLAMFNLGLILWDSGEEKQALDLFLASAELNDSNSMAQLGLMAEESGNLSEAINWYERAAALDQPVAMFQLGKIASSAGDEDQARAWWEKGSALGHEGSIDALRLSEETNIEGDSGEISIDDEFSDLNGFGTWEWIELLEAFVNEDQEELEEMKNSYPGTFEIFENLRDYGLFEIWAEWGSNLEFGRGREETQSDFLAGLDREEEFEDENGVTYISGEDLLDWETWQRLSVQEEYLPSSDDDRYVFNIEGGVCAISGKAPQLSVSNDQAESEFPLLAETSGIECRRHETSDECYNNKCEASLITISSGLGDGYYRTVAFNNRSGDIECIMTYFSYNWEHVESKLILGEGTIGTKDDGTLVGNLEDHVPIYLGEIKSGGSLNFGDRWAWSEAGRGDDYKIASITVPADEYLVLGWIHALSFEPDDVRVFIVGLYRGEMKQYYLDLMDEFPVMKTFADEYLDFARNLGDF